MNIQTQKKKAEALLSLHTNGKLLVLPNIWNPIGARILESKNFPAVATASAAVAASLGYADGEKIKRSTLIDIITRIAQCVDVPVTVDIESGYGATISALEETILQVIESGVVGINIEDSLQEGGALRSAGEQCERIALVRNIADTKGIPLVINARIDSFLTNSLKTKEEQMEDAVLRAVSYSKAGADCLYPIGPGDKETLLALRGRISSPINALASAAAAPLSVLHEVGINRVSFGPFIFRSCLKKFEGIVSGLNTFESYACFSEETMASDEVSAYLSSVAER
ncbi:MAG: isocitrate lyase/phosphoenolpyruvate mutase family protein [Agarilytica sp.]